MPNVLTEKTYKYSDTDPKMREILDYFKKLYDEKQKLLNKMSVD